MRISVTEVRVQARVPVRVDTEVVTDKSRDRNSRRKIRYACNAGSRTEESDGSHGPLVKWRLVTTVTTCK